MQFNQLKPNTKNRKPRKVGRGGKRGTYSGKGMKGQKSRSGRRMRPELRDIIKKLPKRRGYRFKPVQEKPLIVNLNVIDKNFSDGEDVTPKTVFGKKMFSGQGGKVKAVKILGNGELSKKLNFTGVMVSQSAKAKIEKAGGKIG